MSQSTADLANSTPGSAASTPATDTPPVIQIDGDNLAIIQFDAAYNDLGATHRPAPARFAALTGVRLHELPFAPDLVRCAHGA